MSGAADSRSRLSAFAPAKVNLTLRVHGRRPDGYHELESLVVFADIGDTVTLTPAETVSLTVGGPTADAAGDLADNLVLKATRALATRVDGLRAGRFHLEKRLPVAAGLGGGSSDAAAALRLLAALNRLAPGDTRLYAAAQATGADVPVCLAPRTRLMRGIGERLSAPLACRAIAAVLVNPRVAVATRDVFQMLAAPPLDPGATVETVPPAHDIAAFAANGVNDLQAPAIRLQPAIADVLAALSALPGGLWARMSGSGATCFAVFGNAAAAAAAAAALSAAHPGWWVAATMLGDGTAADKQS